MDYLKLSREILQNYEGRETIAVYFLSEELFQNHIYVLLANNRAEKLSIIKVISGENIPDSGGLYYDDQGLIEKECLIEIYVRFV